MAHVPHRGLLDRLDRVDRLLSGVELEGLETGTLTERRRAARAATVQIRNAQLELNEIRRQIERSGQETKT